MKFPNKLSSDEEHILLKQASEGNIEARNKLIEHNLRLVTHTISRCKSLVPDKDDRFSIGCEALIHAVDTYNPSHGANLGSYIHQVIISRLTTEYQKQNYMKRKSPGTSYFDAPITAGRNDDVFSLHDIIPAREPSAIELIIKEENKREVNWAISTLVPLQREILNLLYFEEDPVSYPEIGVRCGYSRGWVHWMEEKALKQCKQFLHANCA